MLESETDCKCRETERNEHLKKVKKVSTVCNSYHATNTKEQKFELVEPIHQPTCIVHKYPSTRRKNKTKKLSNDGINSWQLSDVSLPTEKHDLIEF